MWPCHQPQETKTTNCKCFLFVVAICAVLSRCFRRPFAMQDVPFTMVLHSGPPFSNSHLAMYPSDHFQDIHPPWEAAKSPKGPFAMQDVPFTMVLHSGPPFSNSHLAMYPSDHFQDIHPPWEAAKSPKGQKHEYIKRVPSNGPELVEPPV